MRRLKVATFGEAERGKFSFPYIIRDLGELEHALGNPPGESLGLFYAVQALLFEKELVFFRVSEEGYGKKEYLNGIKELERMDPKSPIGAIILPGVGDDEIISATKNLCRLNKSLLVLTEKDLYDYLTAI